MTAIPEDIQIIADRITAGVDADWYWDGMASLSDVIKAQALTSKAIAEALMAERERAAKIADRWRQSDWIFAARSIASAIRTPDKSRT